MFGRTTDAKLQMLKRLDVFSHLPHRKLVDLGGRLDVLDVDAGTELTHQGGNGREFFVVIEGAARVERDGVVVAIVGAGDVIGEMALLEQAPRNATVVAQTPMRLLVGSRQYFQPLLDQYPAFAEQLFEAVEQRRAAQAA